jgi:hypothetical protein
LSTHPRDRAARPPGRHLTAALVVFSFACAGVAGEVSAATAAHGPDLRAASSTHDPRQNHLPFVITSDPDPDFALSRDDGPDRVADETRHRLHRPAPRTDRPAERTAQSVHSAEGRRLDLAPGLARACAGRLTSYATAPPIPVA